MYLRSENIIFQYNSPSLLWSRVTDARQPGCFEIYTGSLLEHLHQQE